MPAPSTSRLLGWVGIAVVVAISAVVWVYAFVLADPEPTDKLASPAFATEAKPICARAVKQLDDAGLQLKKAATPLERADLVKQADDILKTMVDGLKPIAPTTGDDARLITAWLGDWRTWFSDRAKWEATLREGKGSAFFETQRETGEPNSTALTKLAVSNDIPDCGIPYGV